MSAETRQSGSDRLESVDLLRGAVMVIMALDHVRDYWSNRLFDDPTDLNTTTIAIFLTRWITHYCAPTFIFLAGTGAFLSGARGKSKRQLSWFLLSRGLWLVFLELTIMRLVWMFGWDLYNHGPGVFWAIGWSMVVLAGLVQLPTALVTTFGVAMIAFHNLLDGFTADQLHLPQWLWNILHQPGGAPLFKSFTIGTITIKSVSFGTGYCLIPWMGVMAAGYGFGQLLLLDPPARRRALWTLGGLLTAGFFVLRAINVYGDSVRPWLQQPDSARLACSFLNCQKYPPSLHYLLMTLGPAILFLALFDRPLGWWAKPIITFGRVPLFYYLLHIPLIHGGVVLYDHIRFGWSPQSFDGPWAVRPTTQPGYGVDLGTVYLIWIAVILILYPACWWYADFKRRHRSIWLSYL
jgi:uncharacterized membrane protein